MIEYNDLWKEKKKQATINPKDKKRKKKKAKNK
jgi:hypothetical protein